MKTGQALLTSTILKSCLGWSRNPLECWLFPSFIFQSRIPNPSINSLIRKLQRLALSDAFGWKAKSWFQIFIFLCCIRPLYFFAIRIPYDRNFCSVKDNSLSKITAVNYLLIKLLKILQPSLRSFQQKKYKFRDNVKFVFCHNIIFNGRRDVIDYDNELRQLHINVGQVVKF